VFRVGIGFDAHRLHALADALLGAVAAPDIGALFPPGDPQWKDAESRRFVERALAIVGERGYRVSSIDVVVIAEAPKLAPHWPAIREHLSKLLGIEPGAVGLKATTTDGMGFAGRGEGLAVQAVVTVTSAGPGGPLPPRQGARGSAGGGAGAH
jgi:2-C-methyl-D-erythritol 4-phosphate cytidylyltransferase/2-C-methyl-D-erythritol 2,4-cyclodiphosphate synthase